MLSVPVAFHNSPACPYHGFILDLARSYSPIRHQTHVRLTVLGLYSQSIPLVILDQYLSKGRIQVLETFTQATRDTLRSLWKTFVVWEEVVFNLNLTLSNDSIALVRISSDDAAAVAAKGFHFIYEGAGPGHE
ncbi:hypothetical protein H4582DRAFT_435202 [Lactarius indigo]|nr:hypothetical protein H4582DRAFT_435202 [Lactarius indigo]